MPAAAASAKQRHHLIGAYNWRSDRVAYKAVPWKNSESFIAFLEHLLVSVYPVGRMVLVMDNAAYPRSAATLAALRLFEHRLRVVWLPAYCAHLNRIERFWRHLKDLACANKLEASLEHLVTAIECGLSNQNNPNYPLPFSAF
ncbi:MAG: transposase [Anaerolineales bacterium]|nr:transposase [Anaerolineales bacterium]